MHKLQNFAGNEEDGGRFLSVEELWAFRPTILSDVAAVGFALRREGCSAKGAATKTFFSTEFVGSRDALVVVSSAQGFGSHETALLLSY